MSLITSYGFFDPSQLSHNLIWMGIAWGIHYGLKKLFQRHPIKINKHQIWRKFQWFKIISQILCFVSCMYIGSFWEFVGADFIKRQFDKIMIYNIKCGFAIFKKLDPEMAEYLYTKLKEWITKHQ